MKVSVINLGCTKASKNKRSVKEHPFFGMCADDKKTSVNKIMKKLSKCRYSALSFHP